MVCNGCEEVLMRYARSLKFWVVNLAFNEWMVLNNRRTCGMKYQTALLPLKKYVFSWKFSSQKLILLKNNRIDLVIQFKT